MVLTTKPPATSPIQWRMKLGWHRTLRWLGCLAAGAGFACITSQANAKALETVSTRLYVNYSAKPSPADLASFDLSILDPNAEIDLTSGHRLGRKFLAYISTVEIRPGSPVEKVAKKRKVPVAGTNTNWGTRLMDITSPEWRPMIINDLARAAEEKGFDGFFLDTLDSAELLAKDSKQQTRACREALIGLIKELRRRFPVAPIILNRGFSLLDDVASSVSGVLVESVFQTFDPKTRQYRAVMPEDTAWLEKRIRDIQARRLPVYAVDYVAAHQKNLARETAKKLSALGCIPFVTTQELDGTALAPLGEVPRRVLVLYGWDPRSADKARVWPIDTFTAAHLQTALEWMGWEAEYLNVGTEDLPDPLPPRFGGVILDECLTLRPEDETAAAKWLLLQKDHGVPVLFAGGVPFADAGAKAALCAGLGLTGHLRTVNGAQRVRIARLDGDLMNAEARVSPHSLGFRDLTAPADAKVFLSLQAEDRVGSALRFDPVFLASWGGMWLDPYVAQRAGADSQQMLADPFRFLALWLGHAEEFPVPDTTTRDGLRVFFSQIDGTGFTDKSHLAGHPACAEVVQSRILKNIPLPVTVSLMEADTRAFRQGQNPRDRQRFENIARSIFSIAHVQAASHSFSNAGTELNVTGRAAMETTTVEREIGGSIDYINRWLLPATKRVEVMLWPDDCRPGDRALEVCRTLGVENMNGGRNVISSLNPGISGIAPRSMPWGGEIQIFSASPVAYAASGTISGHDLRGVADVFDGFARTENPRRLKPIDLHYDFRAAAQPASVGALEKICTWCAESPLHPVTVRDYARSVRDAARTKIYQAAPRSWIVVNAGDLRTLRVPASAGVPDLARSRGIAGWKTEGDVTYIHTTGRPCTELALTEPAVITPPRLRLVESGADLHFFEMNATRAVFEAGGWSATDVVFAGIPPGAMVDVKTNKQPGRIQADASGTLKLSLTPHSTVALSIPPLSYAAAR